MECNEAQWVATSRNNRAKRIVLSTKKALVVGGESRSQLFLQKNHKFSNLITNAPLLLIWKGSKLFNLKFLNYDNARKNFIIWAATGAHSKSGRESRITLEDSSWEAATTASWRGTDERGGCLQAAWQIKICGVPNSEMSRHSVYPPR